MQQHTTPNRRSYTGLLAAFGLIGFLVVLISAPHGTSTSPDSLSYMSVARNLLAGEGYTRYNGELLTVWPPLYPALLAGIFGFGDLTGTDLNLLHILRFANALTFAVTIFFAGRLFLRRMRSPVLAFLALLAAVLGYPLVYVAAFAWSEALFVLLCVLFFLLLDHYLDTPTPRAFTGLILVAALASLQRYPGALLIGIGGLALLLAEGIPFRQRLRRAVAFGAPSGLPLALWLVRNVVRADTLTGSRPDSTRGLRSNISRTYDVLVAWFTPESFGIGYLVAAGIVAGVIVLGVAITVLRGHRIEPRRMARAGWFPMALFVGLYLAFFIISASRVHFDVIDDRLLAPVYVFVIGLVFLLLDALVFQLQARQRGLLVLLVVNGAALWLLYPINRLYDELPTWQTISEASQDTWRAWHESDLMEHLREGDFDGPVYTNAPLPVLVHSGLTVASVPQNIKNWSPPAGAELLAWFDDLPPCSLGRRHCIDTGYTLDDLETHLAREPVITARDGGVYSLQNMTLNAAVVHDRPVCYNSSRLTLEYK